MHQTVYILTWSNHVDNLYGNTLIFKTLRVGFPNAEIHVVDNNSSTCVRPSLKQLAQDSGAKYTQLEDSISHHDFIEKILSTQHEGTVIFVDPDVCFWDNVEDWNFEALVAGRLIPSYRCEYTGCITHPRLHTSFFWFPDVIALRKAIQGLQTNYIDFAPFSPLMFLLDNIWHRYDTGASLYAAFAERVYSFTEIELEAYDHLFCGTHFKVVVPKIRPDYALLFERLHRHVHLDYRILKGTWRIQEQYFKALSV